MCGRIAGDLGDGLLGVVLARSGASGAASGVGVVSLAHDAAGLDHVVEGGDGVTAVAAAIDLVAVHSLLVRQQGGGVAGQDPGRLGLSGGREGPARSALSLVLHGGDSDRAAVVRSAPIVRLRDGREAVGQRQRGVLAEQSGVADGGAVVEVLALELGRVQVRELWWSQREGYRTGRTDGHEQTQCERHKHAGMHDAHDSCRHVAADFRCPFSHLVDAESGLRVEALQLSSAGQVGLEDVETEAVKATRRRGGRVMSIEQRTASGGCSNALHVMERTVALAPASLSPPLRSSCQRGCPSWAVS